ncbi:hypothetical protein CEXT_651831 [Caerostris extrusa]|uniref:Uncharacterized protein n=1 Tax=Caerostris extrusa TaxID=172846 RepID=A0AAV4X6F9_CAEEX|nr:hypothetical protein CEXT_651831 [Caerostris extrusa]
MSPQETTDSHPKQTTAPTFQGSSKIGSSPSFSEATERLLEPSTNKEIIDSKRKWLLSTAEDGVENMLYLPDAIHVHPKP